MDLKESRGIHLLHSMLCLGKSALDPKGIGKSEPGRVRGA